MTTEKKISTSIEKALALLNLFTETESVMNLEQIAAKTGLPKTTAFRILVQLETFGYIRKKEHQGKLMYSLGLLFLEKAQLVKADLDIRTMAREEMLRLRNELNLSVQLAVRDKDHAVYIEQFESYRPIRIYPSIGKRAPLYAAACPRLLLAYVDEEERQSLFDRFHYEPYTAGTIIDKTQIGKILQDIRKRGYSVSRGELFEGTLAIAVPIIEPYSGEVLASLSVIGMEQDFEEEIEQYVSKLKEAAATIMKAE